MTLVEKQRECAATNIQRVWRGYSARVKTKRAKNQLLSYALFEQAKLLIDNPSKYQKFDRASKGKTTVYLPKELPIVLKQSGSPANQKRFEKMQEGRDLCERNGYKKLMIPKARVYKDFIVESRLPLAMDGTKEQIGLYIENRELFTPAVEEFMNLICHCTFNDITGASADPYETLSKAPMGRYDNIVLYLQDGQGMIGLVDLERFGPGYRNRRKEWCFFKCRDAVDLFPYHLEEIIKVAKRFDSNIELYRKPLERERDEALKRFKIAYEDHLDFVKQKGISMENPVDFDAVSMEQVQEVIDKELRLEDKLLAAHFHQIAVPQIIDAVNKLILEILECNSAAQMSKGAISSNPQLLSIRTLEFDEEDDVYENFIASSLNSINMLRFPTESDAKDFLGRLFDVILKEMESTKKIAYYNPHFGFASNAKKIIFC